MSSLYRFWNSFKHFKHFATVVQYVYFLFSSRNFWTFDVQICKTTSKISKSYFHLSNLPFTLLSIWSRLAIELYRNLDEFLTYIPLTLSCEMSGKKKLIISYHNQLIISFRIFKVYYRSQLQNVPVFSDF